jgi:hypothetical protein
MGDRSNIVIQQRDGGRVFLYGHWQGAQALAVVAEVIRRGERLDDESYLARIVFATMTRGDETGSTGFGISAGYAPDSNYPHVILDVPSQTAYLEADGWMSAEHFAHTAGDQMTRPVSFVDFALACETAGFEYDALVSLLPTEVAA